MISKNMLALCGLSLMLGVAPAWADVDISDREKVEVSSWDELKKAVENEANAGKTIVLTDDIVVADSGDISFPAKDVVIDGGGHTLSDIVGEYRNDTLLRNNISFKNIKFDNVHLDVWGYYTGVGIVKDIQGDFNNFSLYNRGNINSLIGVFTGGSYIQNVNTYGGSQYHPHINYIGGGV